MRASRALSPILSLLLLFALPARAELGEFLASELGRVVMSETVAGRALSEHFLGAPLRTPEDASRLVAQLRVRANLAAAGEIELRLDALESRFRTEKGIAAGERIPPLSVADRAALDRMASDLLAAKLGAGPEIEFLSPRPQGDYAGARAAFVRGQSPGVAPVSSDGLAVSLANRLGVPADQVMRTPDHRWPGIVRGLPNAARMAPQASGPKLPHPGGAVDVVVVGSGPAGLTSSLILSDADQKVLVLEAADRVGGLAVGGQMGEIRFGSGAAYYAAPSRPQYRIMQRLGLYNYTQVNKIPSHIDSLLLDGVLYKEFWEGEALQELPASFRLYKHFVERINARGLIANQPIEEAEDLTLDRFTAKQVIDRIPETVARWQDPASRKLYAEFLADPRIDPKNPMRHVYSYLDPYGRSALGATTDKVNAMAFFNFQISELEPRFTGRTGTGEISERFVGLLSERPELVSIQTESPVARIIKHPDHVEVVYVKGGKTYTVRARNVVFSAPMKIAPQLIEGFERLAPEHAQALKKIPYTDYIVTNVGTDGQVTQGTYDFWMGNTNNSRNWVTDVINGRFQEAQGDAPTDKLGVLTLYQPMGQDGIRGYTPAQVFAQAEKGVEQASQLLGPYLKMSWGTEIRPQWIIANAYPASIQLVAPGYFSDIAPVFRRPIAGVIYPAGIVNGTPSLEEAIYSGNRAAEEILKGILQ